MAPATAVGPLSSTAPRWGTALDWSIALTAVLCALILVLVVATRVLYRRRQTEESALWMHLVALGILPLFLLAFGNFTVLEYAKEERFCGACHRAMQPYVDDLRAGGTSLASLHFQDRFAPGTECYACHADYGLHGTLEAKLTGLSDVYSYVTGTYHFPLKMRAPFSNALCLKCHDGARRFLAEDDSHLGPDGRVSQELATGLTACTACHKPAHQIPRVGRRDG